MLDLDCVDDLLHPGSVVEIPLIAGRVGRQLVEEVLDQVGVEEREPRLAWSASLWKEPVRYRELLELDVIRGRGLDRFGNAELLDQPRDDGALRSVEADLNSGVVADGHEAGLHRADGAVGELADEDISIIDVHPHHAAGRSYDPLGYEIPQHTDDRREIRANHPARDVDDRRAVPFQRRDLDARLIRVMVGLPQRRLRVDPLGVLLVGVVNVWLSAKTLVHQLLHVEHGWRV